MITSTGISSYPHPHTLTTVSEWIESSISSIESSKGKGDYKLLKGSDIHKIANTFDNSIIIESIYFIHEQTICFEEINKELAKGEEVIITPENVEDFRASLSPFGKFLTIEHASNCEEKLAIVVIRFK